MADEYNDIRSDYVGGGNVNISIGMGNLDYEPMLQMSQLQVDENALESY